MAQAFLFAVLLGGVALGFPGEAEAGVHNWTLATVDSDVDAGYYASMVVDGDGDLMISYFDRQISFVREEAALRFAICERSTSAHGNCDQPGDWSLTTVDAEGHVGHSTSIAVDRNGDPMISHYDETNRDLKLAMCDRSASAHGNCDDPSDWSTVVVDSEEVVPYWGTSTAVDTNGNPMIAYQADSGLKFAICERSTSTHGNCDQAGDWTLATVDSDVDAGYYASMVVDGDGDLMISYYIHYEKGDLRFAICDLSASAHGNCDDGPDWKTVTVDSLAGMQTSMAVDGDGDPMIAYRGVLNLRFALCDQSASAHGNCDDPGDWRTVVVNTAGLLGLWSSPYVSMALGADGDPMIAYYDEENEEVRFAICDRSASAHGNCDLPSDWSTETVDAVGWLLGHTSMTVSTDGYPMISYETSAGLKFATASPPSPPTATATPIPPAPGQMHNCPQPGRWAITVWDGDDGATPEQAFATCGSGAVAAAYHIDPDTQAWTRYFRGRPEISNLTTLSNSEGVIVLGSGVSAASTGSDEPVRAAANGMLGCPQPGKWAISVWTGMSGTPTDQAVASCAGATVTAAYWLEPQTQAWKRYFDGRPEISNLATLSQMQGIITLGG